MRSQGKHGVLGTRYALPLLAASARYLLITRRAGSWALAIRTLSLHGLRHPNRKSGKSGAKTPHR